MKKSNKNLSELFHEASKNLRPTKVKEDKAVPITWKRMFYKDYPRFEKINLPAASKISKNLSSVITQRRSTREFTQKAINLNEIGTILQISGGINFKLDDKFDTRLRAYPSAGARYPLEIYFVLLKEDNKLKKGLYHYNVKENSLEVLLKKDLSKDCFAAMQKDNMLKEASVVLFITSVFLRTKIKYGERGYRWALVEAGHLAQNIYLISTALGIGCCAFGGFLDDFVNKILDIDGKNEAAIYSLVLGKCY